MNVMEPSSIKELFQGMIPDSGGVVRGEVVSATPLKIKLVNDDKLELSGSALCLPGYLSDFETRIDIALNGGSVESRTYGGDELKSFCVQGAAMKVFNALKSGDTVYMLSFNQGKKYFVLSRV